ncbi:kappa-type opioid receptor-like [Glandiceps talaboti]
MTSDNSFGDQTGFGYQYSYEIDDFQVGTNASNDSNNYYSNYYYFNEYCSIDYNVLFYCRTILSTIALVGNVSFVFVVARVRAMNTIPNYHFINLAAADTMVIFAEMTNLAIFRLMLDGYLSPSISMEISVVFPKIWIFVTPLFLVTALLTITLISIERYIAVCHPLKANVLNLRSRRRVITLMISTWIVGLAMGTFSLCAFYYESGQSTLIAWLIIFASFTVFPIIIVVACYAMVVATVFMMKRPVGQRGNDDKRKSRKKREERNVLILCIAITMLFFICFTPLAANQTIGAYNAMSKHASVEEETLACMRTAQTLLLLAHLAISPILYNVGSKIRRRAFHSAFMCLLCPCIKPDKYDLNGSSLRMKRFSANRTSERTAVSEYSI